MSEHLSDEERKAIRAAIASARNNADSYFDRIRVAVERILSDHLARVTAERDRYKGIAEGQRGTYRERDALAEKVAAVEAVIRRDHRPVPCENHGCPVGQHCVTCEESGEDIQHWPCDYITALGDPGTVLADRDAKVAAQALREAAEESVDIAFASNDDVRDWLRERAAGGEVEQSQSDRIEWGTAHADDLPSVTASRSESQARAQVDDWNASPGSDGKAMVMRRVVGPWEPAEGGEVEQP